MDINELWTQLNKVEYRCWMNIKSGNVMIDVKDRDWMLATIHNLLKVVETELEKKD
jgi:hypothetical protein